MLKKQRQQLSWRYFLLPLSMLITAAIVVFLFTWHLNSQTPGLSPYEQQASNSSSTIQSIKNNPVNAPHKLLQYAIQNNVGKSAGWLRMASVITALIFIGFLFILLYQWFGGFIAITGTLFFATTPWIILLARNASADIMLLSPIAIVTSIIWLDRTSKKPNRAWLFLMTVTALSLRQSSEYIFLLRLFNIYFTFNASWIRNLSTYFHRQGIIANTKTASGFF
jgi:hypothetical protein